MTSFLLPLLIGWALDMLFGDPEHLPHPVVYMGKWIGRGEKLLNRGLHLKAKGAAFALGSDVVFFALLAFAIQLLAYNTVTEIAVKSVLVFYCLAGKTLRKEVKMVFEALDRSIDDGRRQVARIVGRDTTSLDAQEIRTAALETLAENLSDGVLAPLFWYVMLGVPGMMTYKLINTFDSMIGYQTPRYKEFGCWAAHIDDIANYLPARLTAVIMIVCAAVRYPQQTGRYIRFVVKYSGKHASPNSGWPESALAGVLDCRFGGPHNYFGEYFYKPYIGCNARQLTTSDMHRSIRLCLAAECLAIGLAAAVAFL